MQFYLCNVNLYSKIQSKNYLSMLAKLSLFSAIPSSVSSLTLESFPVARIFE